ncbi:MAG TPA: SxtJ family membrane protein [Nitrospirales bacterium]|nr:SxtJ family membrane protein [Nitrospirales bacterium]
MAMKDQNRSFGMVMAAAFGVLSVARYLLAGKVTGWAIVLSLGFLAAALAAPAALAPVRRYWMKFAAVLGAINSRILLMIVFTLIVTPIALLLRVMGRQPMRWHEQRDSYWRRRTAAEFTAARMERQF